MSRNKQVTGHVLALFSVLVWGTTFISTKTLLTEFTPLEILFGRFVLGYLALAIAFPRQFGVKDWKKEIYLMAAGLSGVTLYFLCENVALTYTMASNASIIVSIAPFLTGLLAMIFMKEEKPGKSFFAGFLFAIVGIIFISYNGSAVFQLSPMGDVLALLAAFTWAVYSIVMKKISTFGESPVWVTRRSFFYGLLFMIPAFGFMDFQPDLARLMDPVMLGNFLFLGLGASALCFATWNIALGALGPVKTSAYIYLVPVVTLVFAVLILQEQITGLALAGAGFTLVGLFLSR